MIGDILGHATLKSQLQNTENLFGVLSDIEGQKLRVIDRNERGDCMCVLPGNDGLVDVHHDDITLYEPAPPTTRTVLGTLLNIIAAAEQNTQGNSNANSRSDQRNDQTPNH